MTPLDISVSYIYSDIFLYVKRCRIFSYVRPFFWDIERKASTRAWYKDKRVFLGNAYHCVSTICEMILTTTIHICQYVKPQESHDQPTTQARQLLFIIFRFKTHVGLNPYLAWQTWERNPTVTLPYDSKKSASCEATNDLYGIEPPLCPATLNFVYGSHWALCTGVLGVYLIYLFIFFKWRRQM